MARRRRHKASLPPTPRSKPAKNPVVAELHQLCTTGDFETIKQRLQQVEDPTLRTAHINAQDQQGETLLMLSCRKRRAPIAIIEYLLEQGANPNCCNKQNETALLIATRANRPDLVKQLLAKHANPNIRTRAGETAFCLAYRRACKGTQQIVELLAACKMLDPRLKSEKGKTIAELAAELGITELLIQAGSLEPNFQDNDGNTALHIACRKAQVTTAKRLLYSCNIDPDIQNKKGDTALHIACRSGNITLVKELVLEPSHRDFPKGPSTTVINNEGQSPLHIACKIHDQEMIALLVRSGADLLQRNTAGETALDVASKNEAAKEALSAAIDKRLFLACAVNDIMATKQLIKLGADVNMANEDGYSPLHIACHSGCTSVVKHLLDNDNINKVKADPVGNTPLHLAIRSGHLSIVKLLLPKKMISDFEQRELKHMIIAHDRYQGIEKLVDECSNNYDLLCSENIYDETPLDEAHNRKEDNSAALLKYIADINTSIQNLLQTYMDDKKKILHVVIEQYCDLPTLEKLLRMKADPNSCDTQGNTPLHYLCKQFIENTFSLHGERLLKYGADINKQNKKGKTPLHLAVRRGSINRVKFLLEHGASVTIKSKSDVTPLQIAKNRYEKFFYRVGSSYCSGKADRFKEIKKLLRQKEKSEQEHSSEAVSATRYKISCKG